VTAVVAAVHEPLIRWNWVQDHLTRYCSDCIPTRTWEHVQLTFLAVAIGFAISLPVAVYAHRHRRVYAPVAFVAGFLYTIPSLALFVLLIPVTGLTTLTAEIGLVSYTLLILIRNIVAGLEGVPEDAKDAARGMGYTRRQLLWRVELPLALPAVIAGLRVATVTTVGLVTVTALIGKGGFGHFILKGLQTFFPTPTIVGSALSVALALIADGLLLGTQRVLAPWARAHTREAG
jgi:osmoprotectant transport system permease protein